MSLLGNDELMRIKLAVDGLRQVKREVKTGTSEIVSDVKKVQAENARAARSQESYTRALRGGTAAVRQHSAAVTGGINRNREMAAAAERLNATIRRHINLSNEAAKANQRLASSSHAVAASQKGQRTEADRFAIAAKGAASIAAGVGVARLVAMGGMSAIRRFEAAEAFPRATRASLGVSRGTALAVQTDAFADRLGLNRESTRAGIMQLAGTGEIKKVEEIIKTLEAFMALAQKGGATAEGRERAFTQYVQTASAGKLQGDELRLIQEAGVPLRRLIQDAGLGDRIGSQTNPLTFQEINKALLQYGGSKEAQGMLREGAETATASLNRLANASNDLAVPIGNVLTPVVKNVAGKLTEWEKSIDPAKLAGFTQLLVDAGPTALAALGGAALFLKGKLVWTSYQADRAAIDLFGVAKAGTAASTALTQLAGAAGAARVAASAGGVGGLGGAAAAGGVGYKPGTSSGSNARGWMAGSPAQQAEVAARRQAARDWANRNRFQMPVWAGRLGRGTAGIARGVGAGLGLAGAGIGGSIAGDAIAGQLSGGNEWARLGGSVVGGIAGTALAQAGAAGVAKLVGAKFGAGAAGAAGAAGGTALGAGALIGSLALGGVAAVEAITGVAGTDKSIAVEMANRAAGNGSYGERMRRSQDQDRLLKVLQEIAVIRRTFQRSWKSNRLPTTEEIMYFAGGKYSLLENLVKERDRLTGRPATDSGRSASPYNRQAEVQAGSQRNINAR